jgi:fucose permease
MKTAALVIGLVLLALGVACFIPGLATDGVLFNMFPVSSGLAIAFIVTGAIGLMIGLKRDRELPPVSTDGHDLRNF